MISWLKILDLDFLPGKLVIYRSQKNEIGKMYFNLTRSQFNSKESVVDVSYILENSNSRIGWDFRTLVAQKLS